MPLRNVKNLEFGQSILNEKMPVFDIDTILCNELIEALVGNFRSINHANGCNKLSSLDYQMDDFVEYVHRLLFRRQLFRSVGMS